MSTAPIITDQKNTAVNTDDEVIGYAKSLAKYNAFGPNSALNRGSQTGYLSYDKKLSDVISVRLGGQVLPGAALGLQPEHRFRRPSRSTAPRRPTISPRPAGATPNRGLIFENGGGVQLDTVATYNLFNGAVANKTLVTLDGNDYYRYDPTRNSGATDAITAWTAAGSGRVISLNPDYAPTAPLTYFTSSLADGGQGAPLPLHPAPRDGLRRPVPPGIPLAQGQPADLLRPAL